MKKTETDKVKTEPVATKARKQLKSKDKPATRQTQVVKPKRKSRAKPPEEKSIHKAERGRPSKFTDEVTSKILTAIRGGNYIETAAAWAGVTKQTLYDWLKQGAKETTGKFKDFSDAVAEALAHAEIDDLTSVGLAAKKGNWQAAAWRLERRNPTRWGRKDRTPVTPEDEAIDYDNLTDEELDHIIATGHLPDK